MLKEILRCSRKRGCGTGCGDLLVKLYGLATIGQMDPEERVTALGQDQTLGLISSVVSVRFGTVRSRYSESSHVF